MFLCVDAGFTVNTELLEIRGSTPENPEAYMDKIKVNAGHGTLQLLFGTDKSE